MPPKVSFVVPVYNVEQYLEQCVNSLLMQSIEKEIILVDDASTDLSGRICDELSNRYSGIVTTIHQPQNRGLSCARNVALKMANGEYIMFVDSDDFLRFDCSSMLYRLAKENNLEFLRCSYLNCTSDGKIFIHRKIGVIEEEGKIINGMEYLQKTIDATTYEVIVCSALFDRNFIVENALWFQEGYYYEDHEWTLRMLKRCERAMICTLPIYAYRLNPKGTVLTMNLDKVKHAVSLANLIAEGIEKNNSGKERDYMYAALAQLVYQATGIYGRIPEKDQKEAARAIMNVSSWDKIVTAPAPSFIHRKLWLFRHARILVDVYYKVRGHRK